MAIQDVRLYGDPILRQATRDVTDFGDDLRALVDDMVDSMYAYDGVGIAANQIGIPLNVAVFDLAFVNDLEDEEVLILVNPEIVSEEGSQVGDEGCLSLPGIREVLERPMCVMIRAVDLDGQPVETTGEALLARAFCHEVEHLQGKLFIDNLSVSRKKLLAARLRKIARVA